MMAAADETRCLGSDAHRRLKLRLAATIWLSVNRHRLIMLLTAFAMLFAPLATGSGAAMAVAPADHMAQMAQSSHCDDQDRAADKQSGKAGMNCCVAMCAAVNFAPSASIEPVKLASAEVSAPKDQIRRSFLAALPTPPPRVS